MSVVLEEKKKLNEIIEIAQEIADKISYKENHESLTKIKNDIENDFYMIVTVGEFNNGKSTFLNSLIGRRILPTGVLPTTATINTLKWGEEEFLKIYKKDGEVEKTIHLENLESFIATDEVDFNEIEHLEISLPSSLLENKVILVDTPGLNDINQLRSNITYQFIPQADVVFFVLNIMKPLTRTEFNFLSKTLLKKGLNRIIFIANFIDRLDEDSDEIILNMKRKIEKGTNLKDVTIYPFSAYEALIGKENNDDELVQISGILEIEKKMKELCSSGSRSEEKLERYKIRLLHLINDLEEFIAEKQLIYNKKEKELKEDLEQIHAWDNHQKERTLQLEEYIQDRKLEINTIVRKSIDHQCKKISESVVQQINLFNGPDINKYVQQNIPLKINNMLKVWLEVYLEKIYVLLGKLENEISFGLSKSFNEQVKIYVNKTYDTDDANYDIQIKNRETINPVVTSGLIVGGISILATAIVGPVASPIIAMAGLPFIQKKMVENQLEEIKPEIISEFRKIMLNVRENFTESIENYIDDSIEKIKKETLQQFHEKSKRVEHSINVELQNRQNDIVEQQRKQQILENSRKIANNLIETIHEM